MHRILKRQVERTFEDVSKLTPEVKSLLDLVSNTYDHFDEDRKLLDRSLSLSSQEFLEKSKNLVEAKTKIEEIVHERTQELRKTQARLIASIESLSLGFLILDEKGKVFLGNRMFNEILGVSADNSVEQIDDQLGDKINLKSMFDDAITNRKTLSAKIPYGQKSLTVFVSPIALNPAKSIGAVLVIEDITKEQQIDRAKTEFVSMASHQLRTPLTIVKWHIEAMRLKLLNNPYERVIKKNLDHIDEGTKRMIALVKALLNASRVELGKMSVIPEPLDFLEQCKNVMEELTEEIKVKNLHVVETFDPNLPEMTADQNILTMIIQNLLTNSVKYTPPDGNILITANLAENNMILFKITDSGYGIPKEAQNKIYTKLFRADNVKLLKLGGTGLGLYITKAIVEAAGGKIWFESPAAMPAGVFNTTPEQPGTAFSVLLPIKWKPKEEGVSLTADDSDLLYT